LTIINIYVYIAKNHPQTLLEVNYMGEEIKQEQPSAEQKDGPMTLTEKIVTAVLIAYLISLIWLAGSSHWYGIW